MYRTNDWRLASSYASFSLSIKAGGVVVVMMCGKRGGEVDALGDRDAPAW